MFITDSKVRINEKVIACSSTCAKANGKRVILAPITNVAELKNAAWSGDLSHSDEIPKPTKLIT